MTPETLGTIILGLSALAGLIYSLSKLVSEPINRLDKSVSAFTVQVGILGDNIKKIEEDVKAQESHDQESHARIWAKENQQDDMLINHEKRIVAIENRKENK
nr:MAG TPA: hypothetical protein [Caudoviricetes sp.]